MSFRRQCASMNGAGSPWDRNLNNYGTREGSRERTVRTQPKKVQKLQLWNPAECPRSTSWQSIASMPDYCSLKCNFADFCGINTLNMSRWARLTQYCIGRRSILRGRVFSTSKIITSGHRIVLILSVYKDIKSSWTSVFLLETSVILPWAHICYLTGSLFKNIVIFWKLYSGVCL